MIRKIQKEDFKTLATFWDQAGGIGEHSYLSYPLETSFVYIKDGELLYAVGAHCVIDSPIAYIGGFIRNPKMRSDKEAVLGLQKHMEENLKAKGYHILITVTKDEKVSHRHKELGYNVVNTPIYMASKGI